MEDKWGETNPSPAIYYTHKQNRYKPSDIEEWKHSCMNELNRIGFELELDESTGVGLELSDFSNKSQLRFGFMHHGEKRESPYRMSKTWTDAPKEDQHVIYTENSEHWGSYVRVDWIVWKLFLEDKKPLDIDGIIGWFAIAWEENRKFINKS